MKRKRYKYEAPRPRGHVPGGYAVIPFFLAMAVLTVVAFIIPLRPSVSYSERRELAAFPEFSVDAVLDGSYFADISTWFSDTFPGREGWIELADRTQSLHGYAEIAITKDDFAGEILGTPETQPESTAESTLPTEESTSQSEVASQPETQDATEPETQPETEPEPTEWGGINADENAQIEMGAVIQIGDTAFNQQGYSEFNSKRYAAALSKLADAYADQGVRVISAPAPTAVGIMIEREYQQKLNSYPQDDILASINANMSENVITVNNFDKLVAHNSEYLYFRTDHHWTALGAYYAYTALCESLEMEPASLEEDFEAVEVGEFRGSLASKARYPAKLRDDTVTAYRPLGDITMFNMYDTTEAETTVLSDMTNRTVYESYLVFLGGDYTLQRIENRDIENGKTCLVIKDSFGNCFAPFLSKNYSTVYVMDYRKYQKMSVGKFIETYGVDDVIFMPYMMATQSSDGAMLFEYLTR